MYAKKPLAMPPLIDEKNDFLKDDLRDALKWLFVGAVVWQAAKLKPEACCHQAALAMFMSLVQARALYEFYYKKTQAKNGIDDARAEEFCNSNSWTAPASTLYRDYMCAGKPANKRVFHLAYGRSKANAINQQVVNFAQELRQITETFAKCVKPEFSGLVTSSLNDGLDEAQNLAAHFGIASPL